MATRSGNTPQRAMTCDELDGFLYVYLDGEFEPDERVEFERHLAECSRCSQKVHIESALREAIHKAARELRSDPALRAPESLRRNVHAQLRHERQRAALKGWMRAGAAAVVIVAAGSAYVYIRPGSRELYVEDAARRHAKSLPFEVQRSAPEHLEAWFEGKLDHRVRVPRLPNATLAGARLSNVKDKQAAYIAYDSAGPAGAPPRRIGLFVFQDADRVLQAEPLPSVELDTSHGYNVAIWREHEIIYELVSDLDESDIRQMLAQANSARHRTQLPEPRPASPTSPPLPQGPGIVQPASLQQ